MSTTPTTISLAGSDMLYLSTCLLRGIHVLNELAFKDNAQNYWLARITPPDMSQRQDAYQSRTRPFQRRYLQVPAGGSRIQFDTHDLAYGFAYEFGGDRVTTDRRIPARIYCVYLGTNGTGTVAEFRIFPTAEAAMECERQRAMSTPVHDPAPAPSTLMSLPPALFARMEALYGEMVSRLHAINVLENHLKDAGYKPSLTDNSSNVVQVAILDGREYGETAWTETFLPVVQAEALRLGEEALARVNARRGAEYEAAREAEIAKARKAQEEPVPAAALVAQPVVASPVAPPANLLDAIVDELSAATKVAAPAIRAAIKNAAPAPAPAPTPAKPTRQRRFTKPQVVAAARAAKPPAGPRSTSEPHKVTSIPRPANVPAPTDPNCPF